MSGFRPCKSYPQAIFVRASREEKALLIARAKDAQTSLSRYLVRLATEGVPPPGKDMRDEFRRVRYLLEMVSNNLNQMTHRLHLVNLNLTTAPTVGEVKALLTSVRYLSKELRRRLAR